MPIPGLYSPSNDPQLRNAQKMADLQGMVESLQAGKANPYRFLFGRVTFGMAIDGVPGVTWQVTGTGQGLITYSTPFVSQMPAIQLTAEGGGYSTANILGYDTHGFSVATAVNGTPTNVAFHFYVAGVAS